MSACGACGRALAKEGFIQPSIGAQKRARLSKMLAKLPHKRPKGLGVVFVADMGKLVDNHILDTILRRKAQQARKTQMIIVCADTKEAPCVA